MILMNTEIALLLGKLLLPTHDVLAYLDPGTGSFLIQLLIGGIVGAMVFLKAYWTKIKAFFSKQEESADLEGIENTSTDIDDEQ